jgi:hypothetical protein
MRFQRCCEATYQQHVHASGEEKSQQRKRGQTQP